MAGARVEYAVDVTALRRRVLPTLDDEFAKDLGEFQTLADLRGRIRQDLEQDADRERTRRMRQQLLEQLAARMTGEVPEGMVAREVDRRVEEFARRLMDQGVDPRQAAINWDEFRTQQQDPAVATVKSVLVLGRHCRRARGSRYRKRSWMPISPGMRLAPAGRSPR